MVELPCLTDFIQIRISSDTFDNVRLFSIRGKIIINNSSPSVSTVFASARCLCQDWILNERNLLIQSFRV